MIGDFNDREGELLDATFEIYNLRLSIPKRKKILSCCTNRVDKFNRYEYPGDYIFTSDPEITTYYDKPPGYDKVLMSDHDPILLEIRYEMPPTATGIVDVVGTFVGIQFDELDPDGLYSLARQYVCDEELGWNIDKPHSWFTFGLKPHVTLGFEFRNYSKQKVKVKFGKIIRNVDEGSRWIMIEATLPKPFKSDSCGSYDCHLTIGQEKIY